MMNYGRVKRKRDIGSLRKAMVYKNIPCIFALCMFLLSGCVTTITETEKIRDLKFGVLDKEDVPLELQKMIADGEKKPFQMTYADQGILYIARGYGVQPTTGYSVEVNELYETETAVFIGTTLIGPKKGEETKEIDTYPYVVVKTEFVEKDVIFD